jgi:hypothetical protein
LEEWNKRRYEHETWGRSPRFPNHGGCYPGPAEPVQMQLRAKKLIEWDFEPRRMDTDGAQTVTKRGERPQVSSPRFPPVADGSVTVA